MAGELLPQPVQDTPPAHTPKYRRITGQQLRALFALHRAGKTQVEIAQALGTTQPTISRWLDEFQDSREQATVYLNAKAFDMAKSVVRGPEHVQLKALQGLGVAAESESKQGVTVIVGGAVNVQVNVLSPPVSLCESPLTIERESI